MEIWSPAWSLFEVFSVRKLMGFTQICEWSEEGSHCQRQGVAKSQYDLRFMIFIDELIGLANINRQDLLLSKEFDANDPLTIFLTR